MGAYHAAPQCEWRWANRTGLRQQGAEESWNAPFGTVVCSLKHYGGPAGLCEYNSPEKNSAASPRSSEEWGSRWRCHQLCVSAPAELRQWDAVCVSSAGALSTLSAGHLFAVVTSIFIVRVTWCCWRVWFIWETFSLLLPDNLISCS